MTKGWVRHWLKTFLRAGFDALPDRPHPGQQSALTAAKEEAIREKLRQEPRTWTAGQLTEWVAEHLKVRLSADRLARRLKRARITYKRSSRSVKHKQKPEEVAAQKREMAAQEKRGIRARSMSPTWMRWGLPRRCPPAIAGIRCASGW